MTLTKADLSNALFDEVGLNKREAKEFIDLFFERICMGLEGGYNVKLPGLGAFVLRDKSSRPGRNPKTGGQVSISARRVVTFRASQKLKVRVIENSPALAIKRNQGNNDA